MSAILSENRPSRAGCAAPQQRRVRLWPPELKCLFPRRGFVVGRFVGRAKLPGQPTQAIKPTTLTSLRASSNSFTCLFFYAFVKKKHIGSVCWVLNSGLRKRWKYKRGKYIVLSFRLLTLWWEKHINIIPNSMCSGKR